VFHSIIEKCGVFFKSKYEGEVWLIKFSRRDMVVCQLGNFISTPVEVSLKLSL